MCTILPKFMTLPETWKQQKLSQTHQSINLCLENRQFNSLIDPQLVTNWSKRIKQAGREKSTWFDWKIKQIIAFARLLSCVKFANCVQIRIRRDSRSIRWPEFPSWAIPRRFACPRKVREEDWTNRWKQYRVLNGLFAWIYIYIYIYIYQNIFKFSFLYGLV